MIPGLSADDYRLLLDLLAEETVVEPSKEFPFRVSRKAFGYSNDAQKGRIQAALSIALEVASKRSD
jgi:hypothetical protein